MFSEKHVLLISFSLLATSLFLAENSESSLYVYRTIVRAVLLSTVWTLSMLKILRNLKADDAMAIWLTVIIMSTAEVLFLYIVSLTLVPNSIVSSLMKTNKESDEEYSAFSFYKKHVFRNTDDPDSVAFLASLGDTYNERLKNAKVKWSELLTELPLAKDTQGFIDMSEDAIKSREAPRLLSDIPVLEQKYRIANNAQVVDKFGILFFFLAFTAILYMSIKQPTSKEYISALLLCAYTCGGLGFIFGFIYFNISTQILPPTVGELISQTIEHTPELRPETSDMSQDTIF